MCYMLHFYIFILNNFILILKRELMSRSKSLSQFKLSPSKLQPIQQLKKETQAQKYLKQIGKKNVSFQKVAKQTENGQKSILKQLRKGQLQIKSTPNDLGIILIKDKIDEEQLKANQLQKKKQTIFEAIQKLDMRVHRETEKKNINPQHYKYNPQNILSKEEHEEVVEKIKKVQKEQIMKHQQILQRLQKQKEEKLNKLKEQQKEKTETNKIKRRQQSQYKIKLRGQIRELQQAQRIRSQRELSQVMKKKFLYQRVQQDYYKQVQMPKLQERKKKLKQIRDFQKSLKMENIQQHQKKYLMQRNKSMQLFRSRTKQNEWVYKAPQKTQKLHSILQQQLSNKKKELQKDKKAIQQKLLRQENYLRVIKQKHIPQPNPMKRNQLIERVNSLYTQRRQTLDPTEIGKKYLRQVKQIAKQQSQRAIKVSSQYTEPTPSMQSSRINYLIRNNTDDFYIRKRMQKLNKIIQSQKQLPQKARELETANKKFQEEYKRKQQLLRINAGTVETHTDAAELLLSGIKAKMGLIQLSS